MNIALKHWVADQERNADPDDWGMVHALSASSAEFWIRHFCDEVLMKVGKKDFYMDAYDVFLKFRADLLEGKMNPSEAAVEALLNKIVKVTERGQFFRFDKAREALAEAEAIDFATLEAHAQTLAEALVDCAKWIEGPRQNCIAATMMDLLDSVRAALAAARKAGVVK